MRCKIKLITKITSALVCSLFPLLNYANSDVTQAYWTSYQKEKIEYLSRGQDLYDLYPNHFLYYYGWTLDNPLIRIYDWTRWPENIQSFEFGHTLSRGNGIREFFYPVVGVVQFNGIFTIRNGSNEPTIYEIDPYFSFRWANMPWNNYVVTSFAIGEGLSYTSEVPAVEKKDNNTNTKRLLNYLMLEATFALPSNPRLQLVARVHHRSGAFGLYRAGNTGSNVVGLAVRYLFD